MSLRFLSWQNDMIIHSTYRRQRGFTNDRTEHWVFIIAYEIDGTMLRNFYTFIINVTKLRYTEYLGSYSISVLDHITSRLLDCKRQKFGT